MEPIFKLEDGELHAPYHIAVLAQELPGIVVTGIVGDILGAILYSHAETSNQENLMCVVQWV